MSNPITLPIKILAHAKDLPIVHHATEFSAGVDLYAAIAQDIKLFAGARHLVPCGFAMALPAGFEAQIRPRSGLAYKHGITVLNAPGTIDADYRGEIHALLINLSHEDFTITRAMRIAQMVVAPYQPIVCEPTNDLSNTDRGSGGFGSTGI